MLARALVPLLEEDGWHVTSVTHAACDITNPKAVAAAIETARPEIVFNCAAYTGVDAAESEPDRALAVNSDGAGNVARQAEGVAARLVHISTDYVFDGLRSEPYREGDATGPLGAYARSKLAGEVAVAASHTEACIVRTGELYGTGGRNFFSSIIARARSGAGLRVVDDQTVSPTWTRELAGQLVAVASSRPAPGIYHATAAGEVTWFDAACTALAFVGVDPSIVQRTTTTDYASAAPRPRYTVLAHERLGQLGLYRMRAWREALFEWLSEEYA
jgi:dTDP-4-dehydrorhamnose reductase